MNKLSCLIVMFITCGVCDAQNLIPNADFESTANCINADLWISPSLGTPDYYNVCNTGGLWGVPSNYNGFEYPHSGNAYFGFLIKNSGAITVEWREYIQVQLLNPLIVGNTYYLGMFLSLADDQSQYGSDAIGALFTTVPVFQNDNLHFVQIPQALNQPGNFIINKNGWVQIMMSFIADSAYSYITIGNFFDDANTGYVPVSGGSWPRAYFYIDDVCLSSDSAFCISTVGITEVKESNEISLFPNPFQDNLKITLNNNEINTVIIYDCTSREILKQKFISSVSLNTEQLAKGMDLYEVRNKNGVIKKGKVVKD